MSAADGEYVPTAMPWVPAAAPTTTKYVPGGTWSTPVETVWSAAPARAVPPRGRCGRAAVTTQRRAGPHAASHRWCSVTAATVSSSAVIVATTVSTMVVVLPFVLLVSAVNGGTQTEHP